MGTIENKQNTKWECQEIKPRPTQLSIKEQSYQHLLRLKYLNKSMINN